jgi:hypothetical protein
MSMHLDSFQQEARLVAVHSVFLSPSLSRGLMVASPFVGWLSNLDFLLVLVSPSNYHRSVTTRARTNVSCMQVGFMHVAKEHFALHLAMHFLLCW